MPSLIHGSHTISCCHFYHSLASLFIFAVWVCVCVHYKFDKLSLDWISPSRAIIMTSVETVPTAAQRFAYKSFCYCLTCVHLAKTVNFCFFGEQESLTQLWCVYYTVSIQFFRNPTTRARSSPKLFNQRVNRMSDVGTLFANNESYPCGMQ